MNNREFFKKLTTYIVSRKYILALSLAYLIVVLSVVLQRFWQFEVFYFDQGLFEVAIWKIAHFQMPIIDHHSMGFIPQFGDHFVPSVYIMFSPWYWFTTKYDITLIVMSIYTSLSVLVAYEIGIMKVKNRLAVYALLIAYMGYIGTQNALISYIHDLTVMMLPLMLLFLCLFKQKWKLFYVLLILCLGFKESVGVLGMALGLFMWLSNRNWRKHAVVVALVSFSYSFVVIRFVIPHFAGGVYMYSPIWPTSLKEVMDLMFGMKSKQEVIFYSLATYGFLPLLSPFSWPLLLQDIILRFVFGKGTAQRWDLGLYYNANLTVLLYVSAILGVANLERLAKRFKKSFFISILALLIVLGVLFLHQRVLRGPFGLFYNPEFYRHTFRQQFMVDFLAKIPRQGRIMTQNNLAVFFTHDDLYVLRNYKYILKVKPDVIAIDLRPGQNANNFYPLTEGQARDVVSKLLKNPLYKVTFNDGNRFVFSLK